LTAKENGIKGFVNTEHGPDMPLSPPAFHILALPMLPKEIDGVRLYHGIEANIKDYEGSIDIPQKYMKLLDFGIASLHDVVVGLGTKEQNTHSLICALNNPFIDAIGHPGNPVFPVDYSALVKEAKRLNKIIEINNHSFQYRKGSRPNCVAIVNLCKKYGVRISVSSDAHFCQAVGVFKNAIAELEEAGFPEELVINSTIKKFEAYIREKKNRIKDIQV
jgi:putative hydrolase